MAAVVGTSPPPPPALPAFGAVAPSPPSGVLQLLHQLYSAQVHVVEICDFVNEKLLERLSNSSFSSSSSASAEPVFDHVEQDAIFANISTLSRVLEANTSVLHTAFGVWEGARAHRALAESMTQQRLKMTGYAAYPCPGTVGNRPQPAWRHTSADQAAAAPSVSQVLRHFFGVSRADGRDEQAAAALAFGGEGAASGSTSRPETTTMKHSAMLFSPTEEGALAATVGYAANSETTGASLLVDVNAVSAPVSPTSGAMRGLFANESFGAVDSQTEGDSVIAMNTESRRAAGAGLKADMIALLIAHQRYALNYVRRAAPTLYALATGDSTQSPTKVSGKQAPAANKPQSQQQRLSSPTKSGSSVCSSLLSPDAVGPTPLSQPERFSRAVSHAMAASSFKETILPDRDPMAVHHPAAGGEDNADAASVLDLLALLAAPLNLVTQMSQTAKAIAALLGTSPERHEPETIRICRLLEAFTRIVDDDYVNPVVLETLYSLARFNAKQTYSRFDPPLNLPDNEQRVLLHRGTLLKKYSRGRHNRIFLLFSDYLVYAENPADESTVGHAVTINSSGSSAAFGPATPARHDRSGGGGGGGATSAAPPAPALRAVNTFSLLATDGRPAVSIVDLADDPTQGLRFSFRLVLEVPRKKDLLLSAGSGAEKREWLSAVKFAVDDAASLFRLRQRQASAVAFAGALAAVDPTEDLSLFVLHERAGGYPTSSGQAAIFDAAEAKKRRQALGSILTRNVGVFVPPARWSPAAGRGRGAGGAGDEGEDFGSGGGQGGHLPAQSLLSAQSGLDEVSHYSGVFGAVKGAHDQPGTDDNASVLDDYYESHQSITNNNASAVGQQYQQQSGLALVLDGNVAFPPPAAAFSTTARSMQDPAHMTGAASSGVVIISSTQQRPAQRLGRLARQRRDGLAAAQPTLQPNIVASISQLPASPVALDGRRTASFKPGLGPLVVSHSRVPTGTSTSGVSTPAVRVVESPAAGANYTNAPAGGGGSPIPMPFDAPVSPGLAGGAHSTTTDLLQQVVLTMPQSISGSASQPMYTLGGGTDEVSINQISLNTLLHHQMLASLPVPGQQPATSSAARSPQQAPARHTDPLLDLIEQAQKDYAV
jgi:hypothetical protein